MHLNIVKIDLELILFKVNKLTPVHVFTCTYFHMMYVHSLRIDHVKFLLCPHEFIHEK